MLNGGLSSPDREARPTNGKRKISAATLQRMREGQRRRWAKVKGEPAALGVVSDTRKPKRKLSAAGRAAIVAALKKRWAAKRGEADGTKSGAVAQKTGRRKAA
jgi:hypothetical protein